MKIKLVNSPFDFDEVGQKTAERWFRQGKADYAPDGKTLIFRDTFTLGLQLRQREDEVFNRAVADSCALRVWKTVHSGPPRMPDAPKFGVKQFVPIGGGAPNIPAETN